MTDDELILAFEKDVSRRRKKLQLQADLVSIFLNMPDGEKNIKNLEFIKNWLQIEIRKNGEKNND